MFRRPSPRLSLTVAVAVGGGLIAWDTICLLEHWMFLPIQLHSALLVLAAVAAISWMLASLMDLMEALFDAGRRAERARHEQPDAELLHLDPPRVHRRRRHA